MKKIDNKAAIDALEAHLTHLRIAIEQLRQDGESAERKAREVAAELEEKENRAVAIKQTILKLKEEHGESSV